MLICTLIGLCSCTRLGQHSWWHFKKHLLIVCVPRWKIAHQDPLWTQYPHDRVVKLCGPRADCRHACQCWKRLLFTCSILTGSWNCDFTSRYGYHQVKFNNEFNHYYWLSWPSCIWPERKLEKKSNYYLSSNIRYEMWSRAGIWLQPR